MTQQLNYIDKRRFCASCGCKLVKKVFTFFDEYTGKLKEGKQCPNVRCCLRVSEPTMPRKVSGGGTVYD